MGSISWWSPVASSCCLHVSLAQPQNNTSMADYLQYLLQRPAGISIPASPQPQEYLWRSPCLKLSPRFIVAALALLTSSSAWYAFVSQGGQAEGAGASESTFNGIKQLLPAIGLGAGQRST